MALSGKESREGTRKLRGGEWGMVAVYMNERSLVIFLPLFDLVELNRGLLSQSGCGSALSCMG